jgi:hypothetical protein
MNRWRDAASAADVPANGKPVSQVQLGSDRQL